MSGTEIIASGLGVVAAGFCLRADVRRRRLSRSRFGAQEVLTLLDMACVAVSAGLAIALVVLSPHVDAGAGEILTQPTLAILALSLSLLFLWPEGTRQMQLQRPRGIVFAEWAMLLGFYEIAAAFVFHETWGTTLLAETIAPLIAGGVTLALILPGFLKSHEEHRILEQIAIGGQFAQAEYVPPTPECPFPERWHMLDAQSAEIEVLAFLKSLILTTKPDVIVETGTFVGHSSINMAEGLKENGFGKIITIEYDPTVFAKAKENIDKSGLGEWIEYRRDSSLDTVIEEPIDILYSDSDLNIREAEIRRFLPQIKPRGLVVVHDANSSFKVVRDAALKLEREGLLSVVLLSTPRGLVIAQKREDRS